jgi:GTPase SAR1 family protein
MIEQLIVGMPASGKSTFIAALRHILVADECPSALELVALADNETHLNRLEREWLQCQVIDRTKPSSEGWVEFNVRDRLSGIESVLRMPDLRGEAFEQPACIGKCDPRVHDVLVSSDGILLFTNADRSDDSVLISDLGDLFAGEGDVQPPPKFIPENMPEEVKVVEFLQVANRRPRRSKQRRLAVLISAWDVVGNAPDPAEWLMQHRPMLEQFLRTNPELWETRVYGVSAQGGRLPDDRLRLEGIACPTSRISVVGHGAGNHDLTAPIRWLMSGSD